MLSYNQIIKYLEDQLEHRGIWRLKCTIPHRGSLKLNDKLYMGSYYNIFREWENGEITKELVKIIAKLIGVIFQSMLMIISY